jgi:hypothetical protein
MPRTLRKIPEFYQTAFKLYCDGLQYKGMPLRGAPLGNSDMLFFLSLNNIQDVRPNIQREAQALYAREQEARVAFLRKVGETSGPAPSAPHNDLIQMLTRLNELRAEQRQLLTEIDTLGSKTDDASKATLASKQKALPAMQKQLAGEALKFAITAYKQSPALQPVAQGQLRLRIDDQVRRNNLEVTQLEDQYRAALINENLPTQKRIQQEYENNKARMELEHIQSVRMLFAEAGIAFDADTFRTALNKSKLEQDTNARQRIWDGFIAARVAATAHELAELQRLALEDAAMVRTINDGLMRDRNDIPATDAQKLNQILLSQLQQRFARDDFQTAFGQAHADATFNHLERTQAKLWHSLDTSHRPQDRIIVDTQYHGVPAPTNGLKKMLCVPGSDPPIYFEMSISQGEDGEVHFAFEVSKDSLEARGVLTQGAVTAFRGIKGLFVSEPVDPIKKLMEEKKLTREQMTAKAMSDAMEAMLPGEKSKQLTISGPDEHKQGFVEGFAAAKREIAGLDETTAQQLSNGIHTCSQAFDGMDQARKEHWNARIIDTISENQKMEEERNTQERARQMAIEQLRPLKNQLIEIKATIPPAAATTGSTGALAAAPPASTKGYTPLEGDAISAQRRRLAEIAKQFDAIKKDLPYVEKMAFENELKAQQEAFNQAYPLSTMQKIGSYIPNPFSR